MLITISFNCKDEPPAPTREEFLTGNSSKTWKISQLLVNDMQYTDTSCVDDDLYVFYSDQKYQRTEGATKCSPDLPDVKFDGYWFFSKDKDMLYITNNNDTVNPVYRYIVNEILEDKLKITYRDSLDYTYKITYIPN